MNYRPLEVDVEADGLKVCQEVVRPDHRRDLLPEGAHGRVVHLGHVVLQAHAELGFTPTHAHGRYITSKFLEAKLKYALWTCLASSYLKLHKFDLQQIFPYQNPRRL